MRQYSTFKTKTRKPLKRVPLRKLYSSKTENGRIRIQGDAAQNHHSRLHGVSPLKRGGKLQSGGSLKRFGKKAKLRESINRQLRARFRAMGLYDVCEARLTGCWGTDLTWMHGKKDRLLTMPEREFLVIRACSVCHGDVELWGHAEMLEFVETVIANRKVAA